MSAIQAVAGQRLSRWLDNFADRLEGEIGQRPSVELRQEKAAAPPRDLLWWRTKTEAPDGVAWIGLAGGTLDGIARYCPGVQAGGQPLRALAEILSQSWGVNGEFTKVEPHAAADRVSVAFPNGEEFDLFVVAESFPAATLVDGSQVRQLSSLGILLDIELPVTLRFGKVRMALGDVLGLDTGSVVELDRPSTEPVDVLVNGSIVARGEAVTVQGNYAVRITEIISRKERLDTTISLREPKGSMA